jgi:hypothetical protein
MLSYLTTEVNERVSDGVSRKFVYQQARKAGAALDDVFLSGAPQDETLFQLTIIPAWLRQGARPEPLEQATQLVAEGDALGDKVVAAPHQGAQCLDLVRDRHEGTEAMAIGAQDVGEHVSIALIALATGGAVTRTVLPEFVPASVAGGRSGGLVRLGGLQQAHYGRSATEEAEPAVVGGSMLMRAGAGAEEEEVAQFIVASTESVGRSWALEPTHRLISTFDATVILLHAIVEVAVGAVLHAFTQRRADRTRVTVVAIRGYPVRRHIGDCFGGLEKRLRSRHVTMLAEHHVDQRAAAVNGAIEVAPMPVHLDVRSSGAGHCSPALSQNRT